MKKLSALSCAVAALAAAGVCASAFAQDTAMRRVEVRAGVAAGVANVPNPLDYGIFLVDVSENSRDMVVAELRRAHDAGEFLAPKPQDYGVFLAPAAYGSRQIAQAERLR